MNKKIFYKSKIVNNFWNNNYIEYESNGNKKNNLSVDKYLNKIKPFLRNITIDIIIDAWKIQLTTALTITLSLQKILKKSV